MEGKSLMNHIIICNWSDKTDTIVKELHSPVIKNKKPIVIITDKMKEIPSHKDIDEYDDVFFVPGDPSDDKILLHAGIKEAETAIVLADEKLGDNADTKSILIALAIEALQPKVHTVVEILHKKNIIYFEHTSVDEIICVDELSEKLLAQSSITHGLSDVYLHLLTATDDTNEIYIVDVPNSFIGQPYYKLRNILNTSKQEVILIGLVTQEYKEKQKKKILDRHGNEILSNFLTINPPAKKSENTYNEKNIDYKLKQNDKIVVIAYEYPDLKNL